MAITDGGATMTMPVAPTGMMGGGFGGENGWWIILFLIVLFGWGRNGYGNNNGGVMDGYVLTSDFANIERKLDAVNSGICDSTFALNNSINGGFATAELSRANQQAALMQQLNAMQMQSQECCCENRALSPRCGTTWRRRPATPATLCRRRPGTSWRTRTPIPVRFWTS